MPQVNFNNEGRLENDNDGNTVIPAVTGGSSGFHLIHNDSDHSVYVEFDTSNNLSINFPASELHPEDTPAAAGATTYRTLAPGETIRIGVSVTGDSQGNFRMSQTQTQARHMTSAVRLFRKTRATETTFGRLFSAAI